MIASITNALASSGGEDSFDLPLDATASNTGSGVHFGNSSSFSR
jgi:hypothetical protein